MCSGNGMGKKSENKAMEKPQVKDVSIYVSVLLLKMCGAWIETEKYEEYRRRFLSGYTMVLMGYGMYVNLTDCYYSWGDMGRCIFVILNELAMLVGSVKSVNLGVRRRAVADLVHSAQKNFWDQEYEGDEKNIFIKCRKFSKMYATLLCSVAQFTAIGYISAPLIVNIGRNESDRLHPYKMWVDLPLTETPYFEVLYTFQSLCICQMVVLYIASDTIFGVLNIHIIGQFRILQYRLLKLWPTNKDEENDIRYVHDYYAELKKCIRYHQVLIEFSEGLEDIFTLPLLVHIVVFSVMMCINIFDLLLVEIPLSMQLIAISQIVGSTIHILIVTYMCHGLSEESENVGIASYSSWWMNCPMNKTGANLRKDVKFILIRSAKPCRMTAGGFFPVTMETSTALFSSTMSYLTLMRNSQGDT